MFLLICLALGFLCFSGGYIAGVYFASAVLFILVLPGLILSKLLLGKDTDARPILFAFLFWLLVAIAIHLRHVL